MESKSLLPSRKMPTMKAFRSVVDQGVPGVGVSILFYDDSRMPLFSGYGADGALVGYAL